MLSEYWDAGTSVHAFVTKKYGLPSLTDVKLCTFCTSLLGNIADQRVYLFANLIGLFEPDANPVYRHWETTIIFELLAVLKREKLFSQSTTKH